MTNPQKDTLTSTHVKTLKDLASKAAGLIAKAAKIDEDAAAGLEKLEVVVDKRIANLERKVASLPLSDQQYTDTKDAVVKLHKAAAKLAKDLEKRGDAPAVFKIGDKKDLTEKEVIVFIKSKLPASGYGNISQALNDVVLGRGKATTGLSGVLHASAGPKQKGKGCTLFFKRGKDAAEIVGIGQHEEIKTGQKPRYMVYYGSLSKLPKNKVFSL